VALPYAGVSSRLTKEHTVKQSALQRSAKAVTLFSLLACLTSAALAQGRHRRENPYPVNSGYGVNAHIPTVDDFDAIARGGFGFARIDLTWNVIEPQPGAYRWDLVDPLVQDAEAHDVRLLGILGFCPPWASSGGDAFYPPRSIQEWQGFVSAIVGRYRGRIRHWTLWNEPNSNTFFHGSVDQFIRQVLIPGAQAAHAADPECKIVGPDLAHLTGAHWDTWLDRILAEAGPHLDILSHHCYKDNPSEVFRMLEGPSRPWEPQPVQRIIERRGQKGKPFWLTETGWRSDKVGPQRQAGYLISLLKGAIKRGWITKVFIYELRDSPQEPGFGLMSYAGKPKPSYQAVRGFVHSRSLPDW